MSNRGYRSYVAAFAITTLYLLSACADQTIRNAPTSETSVLYDIPIDTDDCGEGQKAAVDHDLNGDGKTDTVRIVGLDLNRTTEWNGKKFQAIQMIVMVSLSRGKERGYYVLESFPTYAPIGTVVHVVDESIFNSYPRPDNFDGKPPYILVTHCQKSMILYYWIDELMGYGSIALAD